MVVSGDRVADLLAWGMRVVTPPAHEAGAG
jgi:hypothetical protein